MAQSLLDEIEKGSKSALTKKRIIKHYMHNVSSTIAELSKELGLSVPTVTKFIDEMCHEGYINVYGKLETNGGRHPNLYGLNPESGYFLGVDIKRNAVNTGLINFKGEMLEKKTDIPYKFENSISGLDNLCAIILDFISELSVSPSKILNININLSGRVNSESGYSYSQFNFGEIPLTDIIAPKIGFNVSIDNATRSMTYGEFLRGNVHGEKNILFVNISWGLGIGVILDGHIYTGKSGFAGEFGHIVCFNNEIPCQCGKKGCLETEVSGQALLRKLTERITKGENSILSSKLDKADGAIYLEDIIDAVNKEDGLCIEIVEEIGNTLGRHIAGLINIFNPELVILGGTLSLTGDYLTQPVRMAVRKHSLNLVNKDSVIAISKLGAEAGVIGACMIARRHMFEN